MSGFDNIKQEYQDNLIIYNKLCAEVKHQIDEIIINTKIKLAFPIEARVKTLNSVILKCEKYINSNKLDNISHLDDINDLVGIRLITVFKQDISKICDVIDSTFNI